MRNWFGIFFLSCLLFSFQSNILAMDYESDGERFDLHQNFGPTDLQRAWAGDKNLAGANLNGADLSRADLSNVILTGAKLNGANLSGANLTGATFTKTELKGAILDGTCLAGAVFKGADLSGAMISRLSFRNVEIGGDTKFIGSIFANVTILGSVIKHSDFTSSRFSNIAIARSSLDYVIMRHTIIEGIVILASTMVRVNLVLAHINNISIQNSPVIGDGLDLSYATISVGEIRGGIILSGNTEKRTDKILEKERTGPIPLISGLAGFGLGDFVGIQLMLLISVLFPPMGIAAEILVGAGLGLVGGVGGGAAAGFATLFSTEYLETKFYEYREKYGISNINSILLNSNFCGTEMSDICVSNIKFYNCANIQNMKMAMGCLFDNVISSNYQDLNDFMNKGAKVNGEFSPIFDYVWKGTNYDGFVRRLTEEVIPALVAGIMRSEDKGKK